MQYEGNMKINKDVKVSLETLKEEGLALNKHLEVFNDMAKQASLVGGTKDALTIELKDGQEVKLADGQTVKLTGDKSLAVDTKVISIDGKTMDSLLEKNGIDLSSNGAKALKAFVK